MLRIAFFESSDGEGNLHSYDGQPAYIHSGKSSEFIDSWEIGWMDHGVLHRAGNKPAKIFLTKINQETGYFVNGDIKNRNVGRVLKEEKWICGGRHETDLEKNFFIFRNHFLYGINLVTSEYISLASIVEEHNIPLWVALLIRSHMLEVEEVEALQKEYSDVFVNAPADWTLKVLGVNADTFAATFVPDSPRKQNDVQNQYQIFCDIISYEQKQNSNEIGQIL